jgi:hypothetical protein
VITSFWRTVPEENSCIAQRLSAGLHAKRRSAMSCGLPYGHCCQSSPIFENLKAVDIASIDAHADRCERHRWERASGGGKATRLLTDARQSLAKAAFPAAGRQDDNSGKAQRTLQPIHSGAKYEDHNTRRSAHRSSLPAANRMLAEDRVSVNESQCESTRISCAPENIWFRPL